MFDLSRFSSIRRIEYSSRLKWVVFFLLLILLVSVALLAFTPWRQTVPASGSVMALRPQERPVTLEAPLKAAVSEIYVKEGDWVESGSLLLKLEDREKDYLNPAQLERLAEQERAIGDKLESVSMAVIAVEGELQQLQRQQGLVAPEAETKQAQIRNKLSGLRLKQEQLQIATETKKGWYDRIDGLVKKGLKSKQESEKYRLEWLEAQNKLAINQTEQERLESEQSQIGIQVELKQVAFAEKQQKQRAYLAKLQGDQADLSKSLAELKGKRQTIEARSDLLTIKAPVSGFVSSLSSFAVGHQVKEGDSLLRLVPKVTDYAALVKLEAYHQPFLEVGQTVLVQFDGFPAVPFIGIPWLSRGFFEASIAMIEPSSETAGKLSLIIRPEGEGWPPSSILRVGTRCKAWVVMQEVPLYYELWRTLNGFPAVPESMDKDGVSGKKGVLKR